MKIQTPGRRIITRGVLDLATMMWDRSQEQSYLHFGLIAEAEAAEDKVKAAIDGALKTHFEKVQEVFKKHEEDIKTYGKHQEGTKEAIATINADGQKLMKEFVEFRDKQNAVILDLSQKLAARAAGGQGGLVKSLGQQFTESPELIEF